MASSEDRSPSIFKLADVFDYRSPFGSDWIQEQKEARRLAKEREAAVTDSVLSDSRSGLAMPFIRPAPNGTIPMTDFIELVRQEEEKYPDSEQSNTKLMVTRLRKIFYNAPGWDKYLIPKAASVQPPYGEYKERERSRKRVAPWGPLNNFNLVDKEYYPVDESGKRPTIYLNQEVMIEDGPTKGAFIDMGHVFAGWDAFNNPGPVVSPVLYELKINRNWDAATWVGDLGSVLAEAWVAYVNGERPLSIITLQRLIDEYAPAQDMLGNIDSYVLSTQGFSGRVSDILDQYYFERNSANGQQQRFRVFAQEIGIGPLVRGTYRNAGTRAGLHIDEINDAAALYIGAGADPPNILMRAMARTGIRMTAADDRTAFILYESMVESLIQANSP